MPKKSMWQDQLQLKPTNTYRQLFWEIYRQEKSLQNKNKIAVQIRKEELLKEDAADLVNAYDIRQRIQKRIYALEKKCNDGKLGLIYRLYCTPREKDRQDIQEKINNPLTILTPGEQHTLFALKAKLNQTDAQLVDEEIEKIRHQPRKTSREYLEEANKIRKARFNKWGATSYRGIGAALGAALGGIAGTILFPGLGTAAGVTIGASCGAILGTFMFGLVVNSLIVNQLIPLHKAYKQAGKIKKLRARRKETEKSQAPYPLQDIEEKKALPCPLPAPSSYPELYRAQPGKKRPGTPVIDHSMHTQKTGYVNKKASTPESYNPGASPTKGQYKKLRKEEMDLIVQLFLLKFLEALAISLKNSDIKKVRESGNNRLPENKGWAAENFRKVNAENKRKVTTNHRVTTVLHSPQTGKQHQCRCHNF
ncbi:hypothetical protein [Abyssalbus ytuae]|uniref:Uncharacterized protein n=1 Tax=Abyssalbus ytuae TaxID=2926907 RepID=A0A9E7CTP4_9FLAO|nr:hypothetical protein [Abyssalbus ytuae]UOB18416.1 hypothetical protein MQE35_03790 [Abyssalbus ytuae]